MQNSLSMGTRMVRQADRRQIDNLAQFGIVHRHFDWFKPHELIGQQPFIVVETQYKLKAALACPPDPEGVAWIRFFAVMPEVSAKDAWYLLWPYAAEQIETDRLIVAAIPVQDWFKEILISDQYEHVTDVVMLEWEQKKILPSSSTPQFHIRDMRFHDVPAVQKVDEAAFDLMWRNSTKLLEAALAKSAIATVVESSQGLLGYQISTASSSGGHLARLAVLPEWQGLGVGYFLLQKLLEQFKLWGSKRVTVNTQVDNIPSLALYKKAGFRPTDEIYPVYRKIVKRTRSSKISN